MNKFDERYDIRFAEHDEIEEIMQFIEKNWKSGHILASNKEFFEYEHCINGHVTFIVAKDKENRKIDGIIGFLPASNECEKLDIWGIVWKVNDDAMPMLGMELMKRLMSYTRARTVLGVGSNPKTAIPLLKMLLHFKTAKMAHYYRLSDRTNYKVACIKNKWIEEDVCLENASVVRLENIEEVKENFDFCVCQDEIPYKNPWYIERRYFSHPIFNYKIFGIKDEVDVKALLVYREQECKGEKVIRIVDYIGNIELFQRLNSFFDELLLDAEYIDMYCYGVDGEYIRRAGFILRSEEDENIIPNYFYPYECSNVDIWVCSSREGCKFFKADGDQDRPN